MVDKKVVANKPNINLKLQFLCSRILMLDENSNVPKTIDIGTICIKEIPDEPGKVWACWSDGKETIDNILEESALPPDFFKQMTDSGGISTNHDLCQEITSISGYTLQFDRADSLKEADLFNLAEIFNVKLLSVNIENATIEIVFDLNPEDITTIDYIPLCRIDKIREYYESLTTKITNPCEVEFSFNTQGVKFSDGKNFIEYSIDMTGLRNKGCFNVSVQNPCPIDGTGVK